MADPQEQTPTQSDASAPVAPEAQQPPALSIAGAEAQDNRDPKGEATKTSDETTDQEKAAAGDATSLTFQCPACGGVFKPKKSATFPHEEPGLRRVDTYCPDCAALCRKEEIVQQDAPAPAPAPAA